MTDISNKALSLLLLVAIVVSVSGTIITLSNQGDGATGRATSQTSGITNFSINTSLSIRLNNALIPFGVGTVNDSHTACAMGTNWTPPATPECIGFNATVHEANLTIENNGNLPANVSVLFTKNATTFIGGSATSPSLKYRVRNVESSSCTTIRNGSSFTEVGDRYETNASENARICNFLATADSSDLIDLGIWINVPKDAATGSHTVTLTFTGCDDNSC
jgi:hypothetical protein